MATNYNCEACDTLRTDVPSLICNGLDEDMCTSLSNDTGLNPSSGNTDCEDLNNLNDCLIGNMEAETELYSTCDWKDFMKQFIPNLWTTLKAIICSICGIWTNIHNLWTAINGIGDDTERIDCIVNALSSAKTFNIDGLTEAQLGQGVQWRTDGDHTAYPSIVGNAFVLRVNGSLHFTGSKWLNRTGCIDGNTDDGNWLVYRYKLNKAKYGLITCWNAPVMANNAGNILGYAQCYGPGETTPGYWGWGDTNGAVTVPDGYIYIDIRVSNIVTWGITGDNGNVTITGVIPCLTDNTSKC